MQQLDIEKMMTNPFYCLSEIDPIFIENHKPIVSEEMWISAGVNLIKQIGPEKYLQLLLENLKGNYK